MWGLLHPLACHRHQTEGINSFLCDVSCGHGNGTGKVVQPTTEKDNKNVI